MIADGGEEYLRLSLQTSEGVAVKNPVSITLEFSSERAFFFMSDASSVSE